VDVAVHENCEAVVVGAAAALRALDRVVKGRPRAGPSGQLPQPRQSLAIPVGAIGSGWQVGVLADGLATQSP
jgi:hypothetical protein